jgi:hypothetical protein
MAEAFDEDGHLIYHGTADLVLQSTTNDMAIGIVDWKFGRTPISELTSVTQLSGYAASWPSCVVDAWIYQPRLNATYHTYFPSPEAELKRIKSIIAQCQNPNAKLVPGKEQCRYCKALGTCPAAKTSIESQVAIRPAYTVAKRVSEALEVADVAEEWSKAVRDAAKSILRSGEAIPGWKLQDRQGQRQIKDANACYSAMSPYMSAGEFVSVVKIELGKLEELFAAKHQGSKVEARSEFSSILSDIIERKPSYQALVRDEKKMGD